MYISISRFSEIPIYEQIHSEIKKNIFIGKLKEGDKLPSIRELAKELSVSVITTKNAYIELENNGYIRTYQGKGSYVVKQGNDKYLEEKKKEIKNAMRSMIKESKTCKIELEVLIDILKKIYKEVE